MQQSGQTPNNGHTSQGKVSVVIVTYNSAGALPPLLDSLPLGMTGINDFEVIVVDNDSHDGSAELAEAHALRPRVIRMGRNAGYAAAINTASKVVDADSNLLILNPDLRLESGAVAPLLTQLTTPSIGVAVPANYDDHGELDFTLRREPSLTTAWADAILGGRIAGRFGLGEAITKADRYAGRGLVDWATGSALLVAPGARHAVGDWDESYFLYSEEVDFLRRVREAGFGVLYEPESKVMHAKGGSGKNPRLFALMTANRIRYYALHHGALPTFLFRVGVITGEVIRCWRSSSHRSALFNSVKPLLPGAVFMHVRS